MNNFKGLFYAISSSCTFGLIPLFALPILESGLSYHSLLFYRFMLSAILMGAFVLMKRANLRVNIRQLVSLFILGFFYAATALFLLYSYTLIPSGIATTIHFLYPVMVALIMILFFNERSSLGLFVSIIISLIGVGILSWSDGVSFSIAGLIAALTTVLTYSLYIVGVNKSAARDLNEYAMTFYVLSFSALIFFVNAMFQGGLDSIVDANTGYNLFLLALLPTMLSDLTLVLAIKHIGSTTTSILGSMEPLTAVAIGIMVFNEPFTSKIIIGIVLILAAVILVVLSKNNLLEQYLPILFKKERSVN